VVSGRRSEIGDQARGRGTQDAGCIRRAAKAYCAAFRRFTELFPNFQVASFQLLLCLLPIAYCLLPLPACADDATRAFLWEQANTQAATAEKPDDFLKAANTYNRLVADGVANGTLFANLGSTLVLAGDGANASAAFARAERYLGATPETRQGLAAAMALKTGRTQADLPWSRTAFFWHFAFPCPVRVLTALCGWSLFWLGVFCRILFKRRVEHSLASNLSETCMFTGGLLAVVFAASALVTLAQERHDTATWGGRTFLSSTPSEMEDTP
jgi:hypothetical protein